jgi:hypothetical protein
MANHRWSKIYLNKIPERSFWIGLLISTAYLSYRYPLQINSSTTSQVYSDTPVSLQLGKFALIFLTCCVSAPFLFLKRFNRLQTGIVILTILVFISPLFKLLYGFDSRYLDMSFWPLAALILVTPIKGIDLHSIDKYLKVVFLFAIISDLIEVGLFLVIGRLPALAWSGSLSVRFGGFLDDPNGFAAILFFLMGWCHFRFRGKTRFFYQLSIIICVLLTQSLTAIGFLAILVLLAACLRLVKRPLLILHAVTLCALVIVILEATHAFEIISLVIALKSGSAADHLTIPWSSLIDGWTRWLFVGGLPYEFYESWWVSALINYGIIWYIGNLLLTGVLVYMVWRSFRSSSPGKEKAVLAGILLYCVYFIFGSANLPLAVVFPINFLFYMFCFLIVFSKTEDGYFAQHSHNSY